MDMRDMKKAGGYLFFFGVGSMVLTLVGFEFVILAWIDLWGDRVGWGIRIAMVVLGAALWLVGRARESKLQTERTLTAPPLRQDAPEVPGPAPAPASMSTPSPEA